MRTLSVEDRMGEKRDIMIRSLTRREIKDLAGLGYTYMGFIPAAGSGQESVDKPLEMVLSGEDQAFLDNCSNLEFRRVYLGLIAETYGDAKETKNSGTATGGGTAGTVSTTAGAVADTGKA